MTYAKTGAAIGYMVFLNFDCLLLINHRAQSHATASQIFGQKTIHMYKSWYNTVKSIERNTIEYLIGRLDINS